MADKKVGPWFLKSPGPKTVNMLDPFGDNSGKVLYKFNGNAIDESGNYSGTWYGTEQYQAGKFDQAAYFDNNSYVDCGQWINLIQNTNFTISYWGYRLTNDDDTVWSTSNLTTAGSLLLSAGNIQYWDSAANNRGSNWPGLNDWIHIVVTFDFPNNTMDVYKDGSLLNTRTLAANSAVTKGSSCYIGARDPQHSDWTSYMLTGRID